MWPTDPGFPSCPLESEKKENIPSRSCEDELSRRDSLKEKRADGWGAIAGEHQRAPRTVGCPRPHVRVTWAGERAAHGETKTRKACEAASTPLAPRLQRETSDESPSGHSWTWLPVKYPSEPAPPRRNGDKQSRRHRLCLSPFPLRCPCVSSEVHSRSRADVSLCASPVPSLSLSRRTLSSNPPPSPFSSYLSSVCLAGGADGFIAKLPPAGVLTGIKILPYKRGQRTRE